MKFFIFSGTISVAPNKKNTDTEEATIQTSSDAEPCDDLYPSSSAVDISSTPSFNHAAISKSDYQCNETSDISSQATTDDMFTPPTNSVTNNTDSIFSYDICDLIHKHSKKSTEYTNPLLYSSIKDSDSECFLLTGLKKHVLQSLVIYLKRYYSETYTTGIQVEDQIILTLIRLRHNITFEMLAYLRGIGKTTAIEYFWRWIDIMFITLKKLIGMADRDHIFETIPPVFKQKFPRLTSIIDCFEVFIESPRNLLARAQCFSQYKRHCTIKVFISCTPLGAINFISKCWGGRASDIKIVRESQFTTLRYHCPGDQILADRGFTLSEDFSLNSGSELLIPAFTRGKMQLSAKEVETTRKIASVRIHIERVIGLLKNRYTILKGILPLRTVKNMSDEALDKPFASCDKIVTVCAALVTLGGSIVYDK